MIRFKKIESNVRKAIPDLAQEFERDARINALYLFGSYGHGRPKPLSDIDVAVLLRNGIHFSKYWDIKLDLLIKTNRILGTDEIDFVLLNKAPYDLAYDIVKNGKILFCRDERERVNFQEKTVSNYLDAAPLREEIYFHLVERIRNGRFGYDKGKYKKAIKNDRRILGEVERHSKNS